VELQEAIRVCRCNSAVCFHIIVSTEKDRGTCLNDITCQPEGANPSSIELCKSVEKLCSEVALQLNKQCLSAANSTMLACDSALTTLNASALQEKSKDLVNSIEGLVQEAALLGASLLDEATSSSN